MSKAAAGTSLNPSDSQGLYTSLQNCWAILETSGTTIADSKSGDTATLSGTATIASDATGPYVNVASGTAAAALASTVTIPTQTSFSIAFGVKQAASDTQGMVLGDGGSTSSFIWCKGTNLTFRMGGADTTWTFSGLTVEHDYLLTYTWNPTGPVSELRLYQDGTLVGTNPQTVAASAFVITELLDGYSSAGSFNLHGLLRYVYVWNGRVLNATDASNLHANPYELFATTAPTTATLSGPTSGPSGSPSTNFTITLNGAAQTGGVSCPITSSNGSDTITTSPVTIASGSTTGTFTVTPASTGSRNITLGTTTPSLTVAGSPIAYNSLLVSTYDLTNSSIYGHYVQIEGGCTLQSNAGTNSWVPLFLVSTGGAPEGAIRFRATVSKIELHCYLNGSPVRLSIDESDAAKITLDNTSAWGWNSTSFTGLDATAEHEYLISFGQTMFIDQIRTTGGTALNTSALAARPLCAFYGDSITLGQAGTSNDSTLNWTHHTGRMAGYQVANRGIGSTTVSGAGSTTGQNRTGDITGITPAPKVVLVMYGINDVASSVSQSTFTTAYTSMLTALRSGLPNAWIICEGIMHDGTHDSGADTFNGYIQTSVTGKADAKIVYRNGGVLNYDQASGGGLHPNDVGAGQVAAQIATDITQTAGSGYATGAGINKLVGGGLVQ